MMCNNALETQSLGIFFFLSAFIKNPLLKTRLIKIQRENTLINEYSRACSDHLKDGKTQGRNDILALFAWTKPV